MTQEELELSPEEKRLLRRFFHRHALPYAAIAVAVAGLAGAFTQGPRALDSASGAEAEEPPELEAFHATRATAEALLIELRQAAQRDRHGLEAAERRMSSLEKRIAGARDRVEEIEAAAAKAEVAEAAAPAAPTPAELSALLERLHNLEARQAQLETRRAESGTELPAAVEQGTLSEARGAPDPASTP